jgi:hypothetical protein
MARPGHHRGVLMALALPRTRLRPSVPTRALARILAGRGGCGRVGRKKHFPGQ